MPGTKQESGPRVLQLAPADTAQVPLRSAIRASLRTLQDVTVPAFAAVRLTPVASLSVATLSPSWLRCDPATTSVSWRSHESRSPCLQTVCGSNSSTRRPRRSSGVTVWQDRPDTHTAIGKNKATAQAHITRPALPGDTRSREPGRTGDRRRASRYTRAVREGTA